MSLTFSWRHVFFAVLALVALGLGVARLGIINVAASSGHWAVTDRFLHWTMRNSVRTRAAFTNEDPTLDFTGMVSAAGHFATTCAVCHGAPGERPYPVMLASTPPAPDLRRTATQWTDRQLVWIVKHGVKFTPMPAWPAQDRDDEVRRMAAFVRRLPTMTPEEYRELAYGEGRIAGTTVYRLEDAIEDCNRCHAGNGRRQPDIPVLGGQRAAYLRFALAEFASGRRASAVMRSAAARVSPRLSAELALHYAAQPGLAEPPHERILRDESADEALARRVVEQGLPEANLPACARCHSSGKRADYPLLSGQKAAYLAGRLRRWQGDGQVVEARLPNDAMPMIARRIPERLIEPLSRYYERR
jgi:cytochrome c553